MITYDEMIESIQIFRKYATSGSDELPLGHYDEQLYLDVSPDKFLAEDVTRLEEIGWSAETDIFSL